MRRIRYGSTFFLLLLYTYSEDQPVFGTTGGEDVGNSLGADKCRELVGIRGVILGDSLDCRRVVVRA